MHLYIDSKVLLGFVVSLFYFIPHGQAQLTSLQLGMGNNDGVTVTSSDETGTTNSSVTIAQDGFLPNQNAASRFLSQATLGYNMEDIDSVAIMGIEDWIDIQISTVGDSTMVQYVQGYHDYIKNQTNNPSANAGIRLWDYTWWQYHMQSKDLLRQRVAFALSEFLVISRFSFFNNEPYAFADFYDILLDNAFGNYHDILTEVTYHASMGNYLTYINNPKSDTILNQFPDENYARELMQLFTIGLYELNNDGSIQYDTNGDPIPTYDNDDIYEFSKVFTGLTWGDRTNFGSKYPRDDTSYIIPMHVLNTEHEPGPKNLLNGFQIPDRNPVDGDADIADAIQNLFDHSNMGPFLCKYLIQRLVTSNPSPEYIDRVSSIFNDDGNGVRGNLEAVIKAILLDPIAMSCDSGNDITFGMLREPFIRYVQMNKAFDNSTMSGRHRNDMDYVYDLVEQKPNSSPSVFNFFQSDHQPIGPVESADLVAPEFQITNSKTITGYVNGLYRWIVEGNPADEYDLYGGEDNALYDDEIAEWNLADELIYADDDNLHILIDRLNLLVAGGRLTGYTEELIINTVKEFPNDDADDTEFRTRLAIYLVLSSPEYLINR
jgi:uncharacterized protein (DUF1800 family)